MPWGNTKGREIELQRKREETTLSPDQIEKAKELRARGVGWRTIGRNIGTTEWQVMRVVDPAHAEARKKYWAKKNSRDQGASRGHIRETPPPEYLLSDRDERLYGYDQTIGQIQLGDPPRGQSALDKLRSPWAK